MVVIIVVSISSITEPTTNGLKWRRTPKTLSSQGANRSAKVDPCFGAPAMITPRCVLRNSSVSLQPSIDDFAEDLQGQNQCRRKVGEPLKECTYGYTGVGAVRIALVGDSHAAQLLPGLWRVLLGNKWQLTTFVGSDCEWRLPPTGRLSGR